MLVQLLFFSGSGDKEHPFYFESSDSVADHSNASVSYVCGGRRIGGRKDKQIGSCGVYERVSGEERG